MPLPPQVVIPVATELFRTVSEALQNQRAETMERVEARRNELHAHGMSLRHEANLAAIALEQDRLHKQYEMCMAMVALADKVIEAKAELAGKYLVNSFDLLNKLVDASIDELRRIDEWKSGTGAKDLTAADVSYMTMRLTANAEDRHRIERMYEVMSHEYAGMVKAVGIDGSAIEQALGRASRIKLVGK